MSAAYSATALGAYLTRFANHELDESKVADWPKVQPEFAACGHA